MISLEVFSGKDDALHLRFNRTLCIMDYFLYIIDRIAGFDLNLKCLSNNAVS